MKRELDGQLRPLCDCCGDPMWVREWVCYRIEAHDRICGSASTVSYVTEDDPNDDRAEDFS